MRRRNKMFNAIVVVGASLTGGCDTMAIPTPPPPVPADMAMKTEPPQPDMTSPIDASLDDFSGEDLTTPPVDLAKSLPDFSSNKPPVRDFSTDNWF